MRTRLAAVAALVFALLFSGVATVGAQQGDGQQGDGVAGPGPSQDFSLLRVHRVDASGSGVQMFATADDYGVPAGDVAVSIDGQQVAVDAVGRASASGNSGRIVFVVDSSDRMVAQNALDEAARGLKAALEQLPGNVEVALVRAGERASILAEFGPPAAAVAELDRLRAVPSAALNDSIRTASTMLIDADAESSVDFSSVVVVAGGEDNASTASADSAASPLLNSGAQLVTVRYNGGDPELAQMVDASAGTIFTANDAGEIQGAVGLAAEVASDRLVVSTSGAETESLRPSLDLTVAGSTERLSYRAGQDLWRPALLEPVTPAADGGFFATQVGFYIVLALAFAGISMAIYAGGHIFAGGESSLDELIQRYSTDVDGSDLSDAEQVVVQTALVQRATEAAESFAADRGFLVKVETMLEKANLPLRPGEAMSIFVVGITAGVIIGFVLGGPIGAALLGLLVGVMFVAFLRIKAARRMKKFVAQLPDALQLLSGTLKAGYSLPQGLEAVSQEISDPMGYELRRVMTEARLGRELEDAMSAAADRLESPDFAWAVMAIAIQREVGGNLAELLNTVASTMVARERMRREVAALTAEGKLSAFILGGLPPALGFMMWVMRPEYIGQLFSETAGNIMIAAAIVSMTIGGFWMKKVITIDV